MSAQDLLYVCLPVCFIGKVLKLLWHRTPIIYRIYYFFLFLQVSMPGSHKIIQFTRDYESGLSEFDYGV